MSIRKVLGINMLLLPLLALLGSSPAFAYTYPLHSVKGSVVISSTPKGTNTTGSLEYIISFYTDKDAGRAAAADPAALGMTVVGSDDWNSPIAAHDARTQIAFPAGCFDEPTGTGTLIDETVDLTCAGNNHSGNGHNVAVHLFVPNLDYVDLTPYITSPTDFSGELIYSKSTGHGYLVININFTGYNPGVESPGAFNVTIGPDDGLYWLLNSKINSSGSK